MRKFYVFNSDYDCYVEAECVDLTDGHLAFYKRVQPDDPAQCVAMFAQGKWDYFKEVDKD